MGMDLLSLAPASLLSQISKKTPPEVPKAAQASGGSWDLESDRPKSRSYISQSLAVWL